VVSIKKQNIFEQAQKKAGNYQLKPMAADIYLLKMYLLKIRGRTYAAAMPVNAF
jgi:hypothetical protein